MADDRASDAAAGDFAAALPALADPQAEAARRLREAYAARLGDRDNPDAAAIMEDLAAFGGLFADDLAVDAGGRIDPLEMARGSGMRRLVLRVAALAGWTKADLFRLARSADRKQRALTEDDG